MGKFSADLARKISLSLVVSFLFSGLTIFASPSANATNDIQASCLIGSESTCPAQSPQEIFNLYGTTTDGSYWLNVNGTARQTYLILNSSYPDGGMWFLGMKGSKGSTTFKYDSAYWTNQDSTTGTTSVLNDVSTDAKFHAFNYLPVNKIVGVFRDRDSYPFNPTGSGDLGTNNSFVGHTWMETITAQSMYTRFSTTQNLVDSSGAQTEYKTRHTLIRETNLSSGKLVFPYQTGWSRYGFNNTTSYVYRWGVTYNNETSNSSNDAGSGIGMQNYSAASEVNYVDNLTFVPNGSTGASGPGQATFVYPSGFQIWGKMANPSMASPSSLSVTQLSPTSVTASWQPPASGTTTEYVLQYKLTSGSWDSATATRRVTNVNSSPSVTISGLSAGTYDYRVWARNPSSNLSSSSPVTASSLALDTTAPTVSSFSTTTTDGSYKTGASIPITATISESIRSGDSITVTLNTSSTVTLIAPSNGTTMTGSYAVQAGDTSSDLTVSSFTIRGVQDLAGNPMTSTTIPSGANNIGGSKNILIDTTAPTFSSSSSFSAAENITTSATAATIRVSESATVTISAGADQSLFNIARSETNTAIIKFNTSPNFEAPIDSGTNNIYDLTLTATDLAGNAATQAITITVTNVIEIPANTSVPTISGTTTFGQVLTAASTGSWSDTPTAYTYQWSRSATSGGSYTNITNETRTAYTLVSADVGQYLKVSVTATNSAGSASATSNASAQIAKASQTLSFAITTYSKSYGETQTVTATSAGSGAITYSHGASTACSVNSSTGVVTITAGSGTCSISASRAADTNYESATSTNSVSFTIAKANQGAITAVVLSATTKSYPYSQSPLTVTSVTGGSDTGTVSITGVENGSATGCSFNSGTATLTASTSGTCTLQIQKAATPNYNLYSTTTTFTFTKASQTLSFAITTYSKSYGETQTVTATSAGSGAITYSHGASTACSVNSSTGVVTITAGSGTCSISASRAADTNYESATSTNSVSFTISKATPTFSSWTNVSKSFGNAPYTVTAPTVTGSVAGSFGYSSSNSSVISIDATTFTITGGGSATITATFTPTDSANYNSATTTNTVTVASAALTQPTLSAAATIGSANSITLSWSAITNAVSYTVIIYNVAGTSALQTIAGTTGTTLSITTSNYSGLTTKTIYQFSLTAIADGINYTNSIESTKVIAATGSLSISGNVFEANTVTAVTSNLPTGDYAYQWFGGSDTNTLTAIGSATASSYIPTPSDRSYANQMYLSLRVIATISGATYTFTSPASAVYTYPNANGASVAPITDAARWFTNNYRVGQVVVGHPWAVYGTPWPTLNYQWYICNTPAAANTPVSSCSAAPGDGASGSATQGGGSNAYDLGNYDFSYTVPSAASGKYLTFTATLTNAATAIAGNFTLTQSRTMHSGVIRP